jgi:hypothetical protein
MTFMRKATWCLTLVVGFGFFTSAGQAQPTPPLRQPLEIQKSWPGRETFVVILEPAKWTTASYKAPSLWGAWGTEPETVIGRLVVKRGDRELFVPFSAYSDLANITSVRVRESGSDVAVDFFGGTGGEAYQVTFVFLKSEYLRSRNVFLRRMPKDVWEETKYSRPFD